MTLVDYYPNRSRLDFIASDGMPGGGINGNLAHLKAAELLISGNAIVRYCLDSKMNNHKIDKTRKNKVKP
ncbi:MAG: hypothetical protein FWC34_10980 [Bacteroidetes bacterium]|nr:hypothetical protein [Bacteroidota bacterium]MCL2302935.1 hypothetical protein [Lentimicrobiaceae bacterium]